MQRNVCLMYTCIPVLWILFAGCDEDKARSHGPYLKPNEEFYMSRAYPDAFVDPGVYQTRLLEARNLSLSRNNASRFDAQWAVQGPGNIGARVNTLAIHPDNDQVMLAGFCAGGIFRTENGGRNWEPVFDNQPGLAIGDIAFDPNDPNIVFAGTGDPNIGGYPFVGHGIYRSVDGGQSWSSSGLQDAGVIAKVEVSPVDSRVVYCAVMGFPFFKSQNKGLYKSTDGGLTWDQILFLSDSTGVIDFIIQPENPDLILAAGWDRIRNNYESVISGHGARIYKSGDGGNQWKILDNGLPLDEFSRIGLTISASNPNTVLAAYIGHSPEFSCENDDLQLAGIYRSDDFGENWYAIPTSESNGLNCNALGNFGWYFAKIRLHPDNDQEIYLLGVDLWRTTDNGENWTRGTPPWWTYEVHADKHDLVFTGDSLILATDGGLYKASHNDLTTWRDIENIPATQFYRVAYNPHKPENYYGGAQDNGTTGGNKEYINEWPRIFGGDGFQPLFHPEDSNTFYVETQRGGTYYTVDGGFDFTSFSSGLDPGGQKYWDMPFVMSAHRPTLLYAGSSAMYRVTNGTFSIWEQFSPDLTKGDTLPMGRYPAITAISESPLDSNILYAGTQDGKVWTTKDQGLHWIDVTPGLPDRFVTSIACSPHNPERVFVSHSGYRDGDHVPYIHISEDGGFTWYDFSGDLPALAVNAILIYPEKGDSVVFVATDGGIYGTVDYGLVWERVGTNMPFIPVYDLEYHPENNEIIAGTHARGIQTFPLDSADLEIEDPVATEPGIEAELQVLVYPTLIREQVNIRLPAGGNRSYDLFIYNQQGILVARESNVSEPAFRMQIPHNLKGNFFLVVEGDAVREVFKLFRI